MTIAIKKKTPARKRAISPNNSTTTIKARKPHSPHFKDYEMQYSYRQIPVPEGYLNMLADKLVVWAKEDEESLVLGQFLKEYNVTWQTWKRWKERSPRLNEANSFALMCIGVRREIGGLKRKLDSSMVMRSMPNYSEEWQKLTEWYARIKEEGHGGDTRVIVEIPETPKIEDKKD